MRFNFRPSEHSLFYEFGLFVHTRWGGGTFDKRIPDSQFERYATKLGF